MRNAFRLLLTAAQASAPWGGRHIDDDEMRRRLIDIYSRIETLRVLVNDMLTAMLRGGRTGTEPSIIKIYHSELLRDFTALAVDLGGMAAQYVRPVLMGGGYETGYWMHDYLYSWACTIAGGSNEIQRNIIAERALGMPREPKAVAGTPAGAREG
jgi:alkylation response protein AidB-like acyl-CoA dehydrogenase